MTDSKDTYRTVTLSRRIGCRHRTRFPESGVQGATEVECQRNPDNQVMHAEMKIGDSLVMLGQAGGRWTPRSAALCLWVDDVDATYARALHAGATSKASPRTSRTDTAMPESSIRTASRGGSVLGQIARAFLLPRKLDIDAEEGRVGAGSVGDRGELSLVERRERRRLDDDRVSLQDAPPSPTT